MKEPEATKAAYILSLSYKCPGVQSELKKLP
jgi:hypothetical protein